MKPRERDPIEEQRIRRPGTLPGVRIRYWREVRGLDIRPMAKALHLKSESSLRELEDGGTKYGRHLHEIAQHLGLHYEYLKTGKGTDLLSAGDAPVPLVVESDPWPLPGVSRDRIAALTSPGLTVQREWIEAKINALLDQIDAGLKEARRAGGTKKHGKDEGSTPAAPPAERRASGD